MSRVRAQIDQDYNGVVEELDELFQALECPVGDLFDDDTFWLDDETQGE